MTQITEPQTKALRLLHQWGGEAALVDYRPYKGPVTDYRSGLVPALPGAE